MIKKVRAKCFVCGTPVDERYKRGDKYYCAADFQRTSPEEQLENERIKQREAEFKRIFQS